MKLFFSLFIQFFFIPVFQLHGQGFDSKFLKEQDSEIQRLNWVYPLVDGPIYQKTTKSNIALIQVYRKNYIYFEKNNKVELPAGYEVVDIGNSTFVVSTNGKYGLYKDNQFILPAEFETIQYNRNNPAPDTALIVKKGGKMYLYAFDKPIDLTFEYDSLFFYSRKYVNDYNTNIFFKNGNLIGVCNSKGKVLIPATYNAIEVLYDNLLQTTKDSKVSIITFENKQIISPATTMKFILKSKNSVFVEYDKNIVELTSSGIIINQFGADSFYIERAVKENIISIQNQKTKEKLYYKREFGFVPIPEEQRKRLAYNNYVGNILNDSLRFLAKRKDTPAEYSLLVQEGKETLVKIDFNKYSQVNKYFVKHILAIREWDKRDKKGSSPSDYWLYDTKKNAKVNDNIYKMLIPLKEDRLFALETTPEDLVIPRFLSPSFEYTKDYPPQEFSDFTFGKNIFVWKQNDIFQIYDLYGELYTNDKYESFERFTISGIDYFSFKVDKKNIFHLYNSDGDLLDENTSGLLIRNIKENDNSLLLSSRRVDSDNIYYGLYDLKNKRELIKPVFAGLSILSPDGLFVLKSIFKYGVIHLNLK